MITQNEKERIINEYIGLESKYLKKYQETGNAYHLKKYIKFAYIRELLQDDSDKLEDDKFYLRKTVQALDNFKAEVRYTTDVRYNGQKFISHKKVLDIINKIIDGIEKVLMEG